MFVKLRSCEVYQYVFDQGICLWEVASAVFHLPIWNVGGFLFIPRTRGGRLGRPLRTQAVGRGRLTGNADLSAVAAVEQA